MRTGILITAVSLLDRRSVSGTITLLYLVVVLVLLWILLLTVLF